ncbi:hypothetical protein TWF696_004735 [Orbilia brochopaga]|uniref:Uncharacterized protein n=1 Tax=Orbilia brochopaga TaxID=3140254 RepID=A0AAV9UYL6_9PEZI
MPTHQDEADDPLSFITLLFGCTPEKLREQGERDLRQIRRKIRAARKNGADDSAIIYTIDKIKAITEIYTGTAIAMVKAQDSAELYHVSGHALDRLKLVLQDMENVFAIIKNADARARGYDGRDDRQNYYDDDPGPSSRRPVYRDETTTRPSPRFERPRDWDSSERGREINREREIESQSSTHRRPDRHDPLATPRRNEPYQERTPGSRDRSRSRTGSRRQVTFDEGPNRRQYPGDRMYDLKYSIAQTIIDDQRENSQYYQYPVPPHDTGHSENRKESNKKSDGASLSTMIKSVMGIDKKGSKKNKNSDSEK